MRSDHGGHGSGTLLTHTLGRNPHRNIRPEPKRLRLRTSLLHRNGELNSPNLPGHLLAPHVSTVFVLIIYCSVTAPNNGLKCYQSSILFMTAAAERHPWPALLPCLGQVWDGGGCIFSASFGTTDALKSNFSFNSILFLSY